MSCFTVRLLLKIYKNNVPVQCAACMFVTGHINISQNFNVYGTWPGCLQQMSYLYGTQPWTAPMYMHGTHPERVQKSYFVINIGT